MQDSNSRFGHDSPGGVSKQPSVGLSLEMSHKNLCPPWLKAKFEEKEV